jgi:hypothetical protein
MLYLLTNDIHRLVFNSTRKLSLLTNNIHRLIFDSTPKLSLLTHNVHRLILDSTRKLSLLTHNIDRLILDSTRLLQLESLCGGCNRGDGFFGGSGGIHRIFETAVEPGDLRVLEALEKECIYSNTWYE